MLNDSTRNIITRYFSLQGVVFNSKDPIHAELMKRNLREAKIVYKMANADISVAYAKMQEVADWAALRGLEWSLSTVIKRWLSKPPKEKVYTTEQWKTDDKPRDQVKIDRGLENLREMLRTKKIVKGYGTIQTDELQQEDGQAD